jgi:hypothetical protein
MFKFLRDRREAAVQAELLADCEKVLRSTTGNLWYLYKSGDNAAWIDLVQKAKGAGLGDHETVRRVDFMTRLLAALFDGCDTTGKEKLVEEAVRLELGSIGPVARIMELLAIEHLTAHGPQIESRDALGRGVYFELPVEFKNREGLLEVREDGLTFKGEVLLEIAWADVKHIANTTHKTGRGDERVEYAAIALQEGTRRTPTKFALPRGADFTQALIAAAWQRGRTR